MTVTFKPPVFELEMSVRDYECDMQGIVNNSVYQNYLEHARHEYLKTVGLDFKSYTEKGIHLTVVRAELDYKYPLRSGNRFLVSLSISKESRLKMACYQDIFLLPERKLVLRGKVYAVALNPKGRPYMPEEIEQSILSK